jgi:hypothetical protein
MWSNYKIIEVGGFQTKAGDGSDSRNPLCPNNQFEFDSRIVVFD